MRRTAARSRVMRRGEAGRPGRPPQTERLPHKAKMQFVLEVLFQR